MKWADVHMQRRSAKESRYAAPIKRVGTDVMPYLVFKEQRSARPIRNVFFTTVATSSNRYRPLRR